jgi:hypothetical protein
VAVINEKYSKVLIESNKNGILGKPKGNDVKDYGRFYLDFVPPKILKSSVQGAEKLQVIVHLMYDVIPGDISKELISVRNMFRTSTQLVVSLSYMNERPARLV